MFIKITHITLFVDDQIKALDFYKKIGFIIHTDAQFGDMRWLTLHLSQQKDVELVLFQAITEQEKALVGKQSGDKPFMTFESTNCQEDYERLVKLDIAGLEKPKTESWGISFSFKDLYGNTIYISQPTNS